MRPWLDGIVLIVSVSCAGLGIAQDATKPGTGLEYRVPEPFLNSGQFSEYVAHAKRKLDQESDPEVASRVALDLLMAATVREAQELADLMKERLLMDLAETVPGQYVLATFNDANVYREFLQKRIERTEQQLSDEFLRKYAGAIRLGMKKWAPDFVQGEPFLLYAALSGRVGRDFGLEFVAIEELKKAREKETKNIADIVFHAITTSSEQYVALQQFHDKKAAQVLQRFLCLRLDEEQRELPKIQLIQAENLLRENKFAKARAILESLPRAAHTARSRFWMGWALAAEGDFEKSIGTLKDLAEEHPDDPWSKQAVRLQRTLQGIDDNLAQHCAAARKLIAGIAKTGLAVCELTAIIRSEGGPPIRIYFGLDTNNGVFEVGVRYADGHALAYRTTDDSCRLYFHGEPQIDTYNEPGVMPVPNMALSQKADGGCNFAFDASFARTSRGLNGNLTQLLASPIFSTPEGVRRLLGHNCQIGVFPEAAETRNGRTIYRWITPDVTDPEMRPLEFHASSGGSLWAVTSRSVEITDIRYGSAGTFQLTPNAWPDLPIKVHGKLEPAVLVSRLIRGGFSLVEKHTETAARYTESRLQGANKF